jgi:hypothetical protein
LTSSLPNRYQKMPYGGQSSTYRTINRIMFCHFLQMQALAVARVACVPKLTHVG